jgi:glycine/D-amino acid oxidase-like deaminating enzyme
MAEKRIYLQKKNLLNVKWLIAAQLKTQYGVVGKAAIVSSDAASMGAYKLTHSLLAYSVKHHGLKVYDHTPAVTITYQARKNSIVTDEKQIITCKKIVFASGYETQKMLKKNNITLISTYAFVSEPLKKMPKALQNKLFWNTEDPYLYLRSTDDKRILVGGGDEQFKNAARRDRLIDKKEKFLMESVRKLFPDLTLIPDFSWAGTFGVTKDSLPYIGSHPDYPNSYFVLGFGGNGITFSVMGMQIISDALAGKHNKFLAYFSLKR